MALANSMEIHHSEYIGSYPSESKCPKSRIPEYAFIGRSNVGKSSLINLLTGRKALARVSKKPGKTQLLNFFLIDKAWHLVDLPGYGYAHRSKSTRRKWEKMIQGYLKNRNSLACAFVLIDANIPPQIIDLEFVNWMGLVQVPFVIIYTKTDRLKPVELEENITRFRQALLQSWNEVPREFVTSSVKKQGRDEVLAFIEKLNQSIQEQQMKET